VTWCGVISFPVDVAWSPKAWLKVSGRNAVGRPNGSSPEGLEKVTVDVGPGTPTPADTLAE